MVGKGGCGGKEVGEMGVDGKMGSEAAHLGAAELGEVHQARVHPEDGEGVSPVLEALGLGGDHASLEPHDAGGFGDDAGLAEDLGSRHAGHAEHGPAAVDHLFKETTTPVDGTMTASVSDLDKKIAVASSLCTAWLRPKN